MLHQKSLIEYLSNIERLMGFQLTYFSDWNDDTDIQFSLNNGLNIVNQAGVFVWNSHPYKPIEQMVMKSMVKMKTRFTGFQNAIT